MLKQSLYSIIACGMMILAAAATASCDGGNTKKGTNSSDSDSVAAAGKEPLNTPIEIMGTVGDGTSMGVLELVTRQNDTLSINMDCSDFEAGDKAYVVYSKDTDGYLVSSVGINLTSLQHVWTQTDSKGTKKSIEMVDNGTVATYDMSVGYDKWKLKNGKLLLHSPAKAGVEQSARTDTFDILELSDKRLILMNGDFETVFERYN